ncbi:MAG TPA: HD domain-containing protein [Elusimicrobiota bacterium]|nr:HD domain-containing protein [Elusimicrobiota bacterium]
MTESFAKAVEVARRVHLHQKRRGVDVPYIAHLLGVAALVLNDGGSEAEAIAAILHDTVEDHPDQVNFHDIRTVFGPYVAMMVEAATEPPSMQESSWKDQKQRYIDHVAQAPAEARRLILADKIDNARSVQSGLAQWGESYWRRFASPTKDEIRWYHRALQRATADWPPTPLHKIFDHLVEKLDPLLS